MTQAQCMAAAQELKRHMNAHGVRCSIELIPGRGTDPWALVKKYLRMHHHTASWYKGVGGPMTPTLSLVKKGRPDVIGPLANGYGGFDLIYRIICMGLANHSGLGGPITIDGVFVPEDSGRGPTWGTEWEGGFQDYETIPGMMEFMGRADAALADWTRRPLTSQLEHSTWAPDRKIDRRKFTRARGIALTQKWANVTSPTPPTPPKPKEDKMYFLMKGDASAAWYLTDLMHKRHMRDRTEAASFLFIIRNNGGTVHDNGSGGPQVWKQSYVDNIANSDDSNPVDATWQVYAASADSPAHSVMRQVRDEGTTS